MRQSLVILVLLACGCSSTSDCGEPRTYSRKNEDGSFTPLGKERRVQISAAERNQLLAQVDEIKATDTGCWFELPGDNQLRLNVHGKSAVFKRVGDEWRFYKVEHPIIM